MVAHMVTFVILVRTDLIAFPMGAVPVMKCMVVDHTGRLTRIHAVTGMTGIVIAMNATLRDTHFVFVTDNNPGSISQQQSSCDYRNAISAVILCFPS